MVKIDTDRIKLARGKNIGSGILLHLSGSQNAMDVVGFFDPDADSFGAEFHEFFKCHVTVAPLLGFRI